MVSGRVNVVLIRSQIQRSTAEKEEATNEKTATEEAERAQRAAEDAEPARLTAGEEEKKTAVEGPMVVKKLSDDAQIDFGIMYSNQIAPKLNNKKISKWLLSLSD